MTEQLSPQAQAYTGPATQERTKDALEDTAYTPTTRSDYGLLAALVVGVTVLWAFWKAVGVDLTVDTGSGTRTVGLASVVVSTALATLAAFGLRRLLRNRGLRTWTTTAAVVWVVTLLGPTAATKPSAGFALLTFHVLVGVGLIGGVRRLHQPQSATGR